MRKITTPLLVMLFLFVPLFLLAEEHTKTPGNSSFFDFLLSPKYLYVILLTAAGLTIILLKKQTRKVRLIHMALVFLLFGVIPVLVPSLFVTPSPVCSTTKPFLYGLKPQFLATLAVILGLSLVAGKSFCGTACPVGALQELLYRIPGLKNFKKKISFKTTNTIRLIGYAVFLIVAFAFGISTIMYINLFDLIHWDFDMDALNLASFILFLVVILGVALFVYRPFCYFICPMGIYTWLLEQISPLKVRFNKSACNDCGACKISSPCNAIESIINENKMRGDCHLCGDCIKSCTTSALYYGFKNKQ
jgi:polyferredoxin